MNDPNLTPRGPEKDSEIADAEALFRDAPALPPTAKPISSPSSGTETFHESPTETFYEIEEIKEPPIRPSIDLTNVEPTKKSAAAKARPVTLDPSEAVEQVWSRSAEWGQNLLILASAALPLFLLGYLLLSYEQYGLAFMLLIVSGLILALLSYPLVITLERPVRVTPEQAVRDYFNALSHHVPHYKRMWLLLSNAGRVSSDYASFEGFRSYWRNRLARLREGRASSLTPFKFQIDDFKSEKSAGMSEIEVSFVLRILIRGRRQEGPVETTQVKTTLVKGPDRMWYLDKGAYP